MSTDHPDERKSSSNQSRVSRRGFIGTASVTTVTALAGCTGGNGGDGGDGADGGGSDGADTATPTEKSTGSTETQGTTTGEAGSKLANKLRILTRGGSYGKDQKAAFIDTFADEYGVDAQWGKFGSDWDLLSKQKAGGSGEVDIVQPTQSGAFVAIQDDLLEPINLDNLENWDNVMEKFQNPKWDPGDEVHLAPLVFGGHGMAFNTEQYAPPNGSVGDAPQGWDDLYHEGTKGKVSLISSPDVIVSVAASDLDDVSVSNFGDNYEENIEKVWERIEFYNDYVFQFYDSGSTMQQLLTNESAIAGLFWVGRIFNLRNDENVPVQYAVPEDGAPFWIDNWAIAAGTKRKHTAEKFIDWTLRQDTTIEFAKDIPYAPGKNIPESEWPDTLKQNPDLTNTDKLEVLDPQLVLDNRKEWAKEFQKIVRG